MSNPVHEAIKMMIAEVEAKAEAQVKEKRMNPSLAAKMLCEAFRRYVEPCPFVPGSLVTPRADSTLVGAGTPYIVLELRERDQSYAFGGHDQSSNHTYGNRLDMRVACCKANDSTFSIVPFWVESWAFEPYKGEIAA